MGKKSKYLILLLFLHFPGAHAQGDFLYVDTLTYNYYQAGDWEKLIVSGKEAIAAGTDYKFLRQRLGMAYFSTGDFYRARKNFEKALEYDSFDQFTIRYLYLSYLNTGKTEYSGYMADGMTPELRKELSVEKSRPLESIDAEFGYTFTGSGFRSDAQYYRLGLGSKIGNKIGLYQSFSGYFQSVAKDFTAGAGTFRIRQPEYFALISWNISPRMILRTGYHYLTTRSGDLISRGHMFSVGISPDLNRFIVGMHASVLNYQGESTFQSSIETGYVFPGKSSFYVKGNMAWLLNSVENNMILSPMAGMQIWKGAWLEGNAAFGKLSLYNDYNGLYVYNSYDPLIMKAGATFTYYAGRRVSLWVNNTFGKKEYLNYSTAGYSQFSYLGGIKWRI